MTLPLHHPLAHRTDLRLADLIDARWIDAPSVSAPLADLSAVVRGGSPHLRVALRYDAHDVRTYTELLAGGAPGCERAPPCQPADFGTCTQRQQLAHLVTAVSATARQREQGQAWPSWLTPI